ncbi:unnamed protein product [Parascedosporium putredinis]|uniref:P-loop containing nucleoside triphosphate hydrolase protein n=1 Tax=Parascedosporium putredinis TaxID=1442378 RepID=A0A9P1MCM6_9PEZI|nr:unnamed protein product [Parascedosporium putredinis]CAI7996878.1 unnamed protein product [Parascedosporium putredinis]
MPAGAPATAITTTSTTLQIGISERLGTFLEFNGTIWASIIVAFVWSWDITLVTSSLILYEILVLCIILPTTVKGQAATIEADTHSTAVASEALGGIRHIMACGAQSRIIVRYGQWVQEARTRAQKLAPIIGIQFGLVFFGIFGAFGLAFWYGMQRYIKGTLDNPGTVIIVLTSVMLILTSLERIATPLMAPDIEDEDIVFEDVVFEYPSRPGATVLDSANLRIKIGQNTALVGPSGSGKSTIVGLLERWYSLQDQPLLPLIVESKLPEKKKKDGSNKKGEEPGKEESQTKPQDAEQTAAAVDAKPKLSGRVMVGEYNLEDLDITWWRAQIGLVQQEPFLFNGTIYANVANGLIGTEWADLPEEKKREMVEEACREAYAHEFIDRLPEKYDTRVGDGGAKLSGGQKQRVAIARAIIKNPRIMILDEATSAMDTRSEGIVQAALDRVTKNRTTITIAHRLSTIRKADRIVVMQKGRVVEEGTHEALMENSEGVYSGLVHAQALRLSDSSHEEPQVTSVADDFNPEAEKAAAYDSEPVIEVIAGEAEETKKKKPRSLVQGFGKALYMERAQWPLYVLIILSGAAVAAGTPIQAWLFSKVIGVFLLTGDELRREANFWSLMWLALAGGVGLAYLAAGWSSLRAQYNVSAVYKQRYFTAMLYQKAAFFDEEGNSHGSLTSRVSGDAKQLEELLGLNLAFFVSGIFTIVGCVILSLFYGWQLGLVATFVTMPIMLASGYWKLRQEVQFDEMNAEVFRESSQFATEALGAIRTVSALTMESAIDARYQRLLDAHVNEAMRKARWNSVLFGFAASAGLGCQALVFWYGGRLLANGSYTLEAFLVCYLAAIQGAEAAGQSLGIAPSAAKAKSAANRIMDLIESSNALQEEQRALKGRVPDVKGGAEIELKNVHFKYPTRDVDVFKGLNLRIEKGQFAALVGPSGCGKTTIISLLERFYDIAPGDGEILCDGTNIQDYDIFGYRDTLSLVSQEPTLFRGSLRDNILIGVSDPSSISEETLHAVCRSAFIHDFIISLPEGYDTDVGTKGLAMSGGQKQRIAIARALIRNPKVLLLDEATSALDSESEKIVQVALEKAREGRTMVAVAHRLSTIQNADVIFVFDEGQIVEKGTHDELIQRRGVYWSMCRNQALDQ